MAVYRIEAVSRDGIDETLFAFDDTESRLASDLRTATLAGSAQSEIDGSKQALTVALADAGDPGRMNEMRVTADLTGWSVGVHNATVYVERGGKTETSVVFEILVFEDI